MKAAVCILVLELSQSRFSLNLWQHAKDAMNAVTFQMPVQCEFWDKVEVDQNLLEEFRDGSFIVSGSVGKWVVRVKEKKKN